MIKFGICYYSKQIDNVKQVPENLISNFKSQMQRNTKTWNRVNLKFEALWINPLSTYRKKWSNTLKQFLGNCLSVFDRFVGLVLKN